VFHDWVQISNYYGKIKECNVRHNNSTRKRKRHGCNGVKNLDWQSDRTHNLLLNYVAERAECSIHA